MSILAPDPRIAPVEDNLIEFIRVVCSSGSFDSDDHADVATWHSEVAFPLFNGIAAARFAPEQASTRAPEVLAPFLARARPFLWWTTPSTSSPKLEQSLESAGLLRDDVPGMHLDLMPVAADTPVPGLELRVARPDESQAWAQLMCRAYGMPDDLVSPVLAMISCFEAGGLVNVIGELDGEPVAVGSLWVSGTTGGLYNIATLESARGRGIGFALTARLLDLAREQGCRQAILHASEMGKPVYERLGFTTVCTVPQFLWLPPEPADA